MATQRPAHPVMTQTGIAGCDDVYLNDQRIGFIVRGLDKHWTAYRTVDWATPEPIGRRPKPRAAATLLLPDMQEAAR